MDLKEADWSALLLPTTSASASAYSQSGVAQPSPSAQSSPSTSANGESSISSSTHAARRSTASNVANLLTLTELRKAAWARIYASGISTGNAAISTTRVPTWKQFDALMIRRHRYIAVDPRDNRTLGWVACLDPYPQWSYLYDDDKNGDAGLELPDGRQGRVAEVQVMVAEAERHRGVGTFLVKSVLASLAADRTYSMVQASFFVENQAARRLLEKCGFDKGQETTCAVKMLDGPQKGSERRLITVEHRFSPCNEPPTQKQQRSNSADPPIAIDTTINPTSLLKRPRQE
ncbi:hypothetical protein EX895_005049 [Sporisorium graminicola]|uniref:N-acetyltransferase domain-containing protein n=1 Tax=Sporisorium graminicola TaxID=280036 RepID=A0A4U7KPG4_9BASI|nr:hypothetical protein EX895_005049 [Sporisorium graminicola]TKY86224.1 hypothetical protein EX895_005049 [Sporisorium graminicola]